MPRLGRPAAEHSSPHSAIEEQSAPMVRSFANMGGSFLGLEKRKRSVKLLLRRASLG